MSEINKMATPPLQGVPDKPGDPLLTAARLLLLILIGLLLFAAAMVAIGVGAILTVERAVVFDKIAAAGAPSSSYGLVVFGFSLIVALLLLTARFLLELRRIVESVRQGDPFQPDNANRLGRMGWITVGGQAVWLTVVGIARWAAQYVDDGRRLPDANLGGSLLLILVLFILARVFRIGAEMRDELEGTV